MRSKLSVPLLAGLLLAGLLLALGGCSLAREAPAGAGTGGDRFVGAYIVREAVSGEVDRSRWVEYGSTRVDTEWGAIDFPELILIGEYDEEGRTYRFPGLEGRALLADQVDDGTEKFTRFISDLAEGSFHVKHTDGGESFELAGTLYYGPPADDPDYDPWADDGLCWRQYKVYRMDDGTLYLNGYGDSISGGGGMAQTQTETVSVTANVNGEKKTEELYTKVEARIEFVERLAALTVRQYGAEGALLDSRALPEEELSADGDGPVVPWLDGAAWAVVEELRGGELTRTVLDRPKAGEDPASHPVVVLDEAGMGRVAGVRFE